MKTKVKLRLAASVLGLLGALLPLASQARKDSPARSGPEMALVVHPDTPVRELTLGDVRQVFRGDRQYWNKDLPVVVLVRDSGSREREVILRVIYQMTEGQYRQYWIARIFRAEAVSAPKVVDSNEVANELLAAVPGSIAVIEAGKVRPGLKVIRVDGRLPGESGYALR